MPATPEESGKQAAPLAPTATNEQAPEEAPVEEAPDEDDREAKNSIYAEGLGPGILYSINYDRIVGDFALRAGFSYVSLSVSSTDGMGNGASSKGTFVTVPLTATYIGIGSKKHIFEIGGGVTVVHLGAGVQTFAADDSKSASGSANVFLGNMILGYRMQPPDGGFVLRAGLSPIFGGGVVVPLPYLALGGTF